MLEREIELLTADGTMDCFVVRPDENGPHPAVIMYMDAPGIREELRDMARRIAATGYHVILPNMYYRVGREGSYGFDRSRIREDDSQLQKMFEVMRSLSNADVVSDTAPMLKLLESDADVAPGPVGIVGYCMSGQFVVAAGAAYPDEICAIASYYGVGIKTDASDSPHLDAAKIKGEVYLAFAETDHYVPDALLAEIPGIFSDAGVNCRVEMYPGTEHGFAFPERAVYVKQAAERHWERMLSLFERNLKKR
jgi:carboxymethylenebutenolidase